ncbi:MAG: hypothetical protein LBT30_06025 [Clostridiales bacterium]|jgi:hypothetical protein|nr:hypothetical protein [Clostridiales bacterium]
MKKFIYILKILSVILLGYCLISIALYFVLNHLAAIADPVWEIGRKNALTDSARFFLYSFFASLAPAVASIILLLSKNKLLAKSNGQKAN